MFEPLDSHSVEQPAMPIPDEPDMTYGQALAYSQRIRRRIVRSKMTVTGDIPRDNDDIKIMLAALKDHDGTEISNKRNAIDASTSASSAEVAHAMVEAVKMLKNENPFSLRAADGSIDPNHTPRAILPKVDEDKLGDHELVDGEGEIGVVQETSDTFFNRMGISPGGKKPE